MRQVFLIILAVLCWPAPASWGQRSSSDSLRDLFRNWAEQQIERRAGNGGGRSDERTSGSESGEESRDLFEMPLPSGLNPPAGSPSGSSANPQSVRPIPVSPFPGRRPPGTSVPAGGERKLRDYARQFDAFSQSFDNLFDRLRSDAMRNAGVRAQMGQAYQVAATRDSLGEQLRRARTLNDIRPWHRELDQQYQTLSFELRRVHDLDSRTREWVSRCDRGCGDLVRLVGLETQFDRRAIADLMVTAAAQMQALSDDLELANLSRSRCRDLQYECRLLRQRLIASQGEVATMTYEDCASRFTDFVARWGVFRAKVETLDNPYLNRRIERIRECGNQTYAVLRMQPPTSISQISQLAHRLEADLISISKSLAGARPTELPPRDRAELIGVVRRLIAGAIELARQADRGESRRQLVSQFRPMDQSWSEVSDRLAGVSAIRYGLVGQVDRQMRTVREILGIAPPRPGWGPGYPGTGLPGTGLPGTGLPGTGLPGTGLPGTRPPSSRPPGAGSPGGGPAWGPGFGWTPNLVSLAASVESGSDNLRTEIKRAARYMEPPSYQRTVTELAESLYQRSRDLHGLLARRDRLGDRGHLAKLHQTAQDLFSDWSRLTGELDQLTAHGVKTSRAVRILQAHRELAPRIGRLAAIMTLP